MLHSKTTVELLPLKKKTLHSTIGKCFSQQDNVRKHTAVITKQSIQGFRMLSWIRTTSPELTPIENVRKADGHCFLNLFQPQSDDELWMMVECILSSTSQNTFRMPISSVPRRFAAYISEEDNPTFYWLSCIFNHYFALSVWK